MQLVTVGENGAHAVADPLQLGEVVGADADDQPVAIFEHLAQERAVALRRLPQQRRRRTLGQIRELFDQLVRLPGHLAALREELLELIEDQHRRGRVVALVPEVGVGPMEVLPERLVVPRLRRLDAEGARLGDDLALDLLDGRRQVAAVAQADVDREVVLEPQTRKESGAQQRGLAEAGQPEEQREPARADAAIERFHLFFASAEVTPVVFAEREQRRPRMLGIDARLRIGLGHAVPARAALRNRRTSWRTASIHVRDGPPAPTRSQCNWRNSRGTCSSS
jgi:hypothetical protein